MRWIIMLVLISGFFALPALHAQDPELRFYALPDVFVHGEPMVLEALADDPSNPGTPYAPLEGEDLTVTGYRWDGSNWVVDFGPLTVVAEAHVTSFAVTFNNLGDVKVEVACAALQITPAVHLAECVDSIVPDTDGMGVLTSSFNPTSSATAGDTVSIDVATGYVEHGGTQVFDVSYTGDVYVLHYAPVDFGEWAPEIQTLNMVDGELEIQVELTSVVHNAVLVWIDPLDWSGAGQTTSAPTGEFVVPMVPGTPEHYAILLGDMTAIEVASQWQASHHGHIAVMDEFGNHCVIENETDLTFSLMSEEVELDGITGQSDLSGIPQPVEPPGEEGGEEPGSQSAAPMGDYWWLPEHKRPGNRVWYAQAGPSVVQLTVSYQWLTKTSYHSSLGVPVSFQLTMPSAPSGASIVAGPATLNTFTLTPAAPLALLNANQGNANQNTIDADATRTTASVAIFRDLGRWVTYGPAAYPSLHGGVVFSAQPFPSGTYPPYFSYTASPGTAHNTYKGSKNGFNQEGIVNNGAVKDFLKFNGQYERSARAIRGEVTFDANKLGAQALQVTWDVKLDYYSMAYGQETCLASGYSHTGGAVDMFVSNNLLGVRIEAEAGVDNSLRVGAGSVSVGIGPLSVSVPIPATSGNTVDGSRTAANGALIYSTTGGNTIFTVGAAAGQVHKAKSGGGWFSYETDHGISYKPSASKVKVKIKIGGNPSFHLKTLMFAP